MTLPRMDHISVVVDDLDVAISFLVELGMEVEGRMPVEGAWVDRVSGLNDARVEIAMMRTPDGQGKVELTKFHAPTVITAKPERPPANTFGLRSVMFEVDDIKDSVARLQAHGAELIGEIAQYENSYLLCYVRGPAGIIVSLAEDIS